MLALDVPARAWGGAVALYSLINLVREDVPLALRGVAQAIRPGGPLMISVHRGEGAKTADTLFDQPIPMVVTLFEVEEMAAYVDGAGFEVLEATHRPPNEYEYPMERVYVLARRKPE